MFAEPGFVGEVGGGQAFAHAAREDGFDLFGFVLGEAGVEERLQPVERQVQGVQDQIRRFVERVVGTVAEKQLRLVEARHRETQPVAQGDEGFGVVEMFHRADSSQG
jgi:hypothetical protein